MRILLLVFLAAAIPSSASVLFSDLGTGGSVYQSGSGAIIQGQSGDNITNARAFTVAGTGDFDVTQFDLGVVEDKNGATTFYLNTFTASIWTTSSGHPGTELGSWNLSTNEPNGSCCILVSQTGITGITLTGGTQYFMVLGPVASNDGSKVEWENNTTGATTAEVGSVNGGAWIVGSPGGITNAAFDVLGTASDTGVPEPACRSRSGEERAGVHPPGLRYRLLSRLVRSSRKVAWEHGMIP